MFTFETEVLGLNCKVTGAIFTEDFDWGGYTDFEVHEIEHKGEFMDIEGLTDEVLSHIAEEALKEAAKEVLG